MNTQVSSHFLTCSRSHRNPITSRYCQHCGEQLPEPPPVLPSHIGDRYRVVRELGRGGFGHTYLAEDSNRFNELCVLKEFDPAVNRQDILEKAKELFSREAAVLYKLEHPQIPRFREWFMDEKRQSLLLVQDYVTGPTYFNLMQQRQLTGQTFTEAEVIEFLNDALPILSYIHDQGVIHRDISPDNMIRRETDQKPILIDFGGVKQVTASVGNWNTGRQGNGNITLIGKPAYAPEEQLRMGQVNSTSDLYGLGMTALALLFGKDPQEFYDPYQRAIQWPPNLTINPAFRAILLRLVAPKMGDRYPSAAQALHDLGELETAATAVPRSTPHTMIVSPANPSVIGSRTTPPAAQVPLPPSQVEGKGKKFKQSITMTAATLVKAGLTLAAIGGLVALGWWGLQRMPSLPDVMDKLPMPRPGASPNPQISDGERQRKQALFERLERSRVPESYFYRLTNEAFFLQNPAQRGRALGQGPQDEGLRQQWDGIATDILDLAESLSVETRSRLGNFTQADVTRIEQTLKRQKRDRRQFYQQVEEELDRALPMYRGQNLSGKQAEQLMVALALDRLK